MSKNLNADWIGWVQTNLQAGCDKDGIFKVLLDEGYCYSDISSCMAYQPSVPLSQLVNPFGPVSCRNPDPPVVTETVAIDRAQLWIPNAQRLQASAFEIHALPDFLSAAECRPLVDLIGSDKSAPPDECETALQGALQALQRRLCQLVGVDPAYAEAPVCQHFGVGQGQGARLDAFGPQDFDHQGARMGQRTHSLLVYLMQADAGGETLFEAAGLHLKPPRGTALVWCNLNADGSVNPHSLREEKAVLQGHKTLLSFHLRSHSKLRPAPARYPRELNEFIPNYTKVGFEKRQLPPELFAQIVQFYTQHGSARSDEFVEGGFIHHADPDASSRSSSLTDLSTELRQAIHATLKPLLETWCGQTLEPTYVYGIRSYHHQAVLKMHRDRLDTHIISAIINVSQRVNQDWPLCIEDNAYRSHELLCQPGDMVFYEGGRLLHGRPKPLDGQDYANIFCHFKPVNYAPCRWRGSDEAQVACN
jgi:prolyl 4-hydroxylase